MANIPEHYIVGVIGAGTIGCGVAEALAASGFRTTLVDSSPKSLERGRSTISASLRCRRILGISAGKPEADIFRCIEFTDELSKLGACSFVIENITENHLLKQRLYRELDSICNRDCIVAPNTSAIPIERFAQWISFADRVVGVHFMNPVPLTKSVELVRGRQTSEQALQATVALLHRIGKRAIIVGDGPGFVINRAFMPFINQAIECLEDGVARPAEIDAVFRDCVGHKMGPLETADLIGLDTVMHSLEVLHKESGNPKYAPSRLLVEMVAEGKLGKKTGEGFHQYL